jgi:hypothetical protein
LLEEVDELLGRFESFLDGIVVGVSRANRAHWLKMHPRANLDNPIPCPIPERGHVQRTTRRFQAYAFTRTAG